MSKGAELRLFQLLTLFPVLLLHVYEVGVCEDFAATFDKLYKLRPGVCDTPGKVYLGNEDFGGRTVEASHQRCQQRCKDHPGCRYFFSYSDGDCHITSGEQGVRAGESAVSGTSFCNFAEDEANPMLKSSHDNVGTDTSPLL